jgi:hypothetical protein
MRPLSTASNRARASVLGRIMQARRWATPLRMLLIGVLCGRLLGVLERNDAAGVDYVQFWHIGRTVVRGPPSDPYSESGGKEVARELGVMAHSSKDARLLASAALRVNLEPTATPLLYGMFGVFSSASYSESLKRYRIAQLSCLSLAVLGLGRLMGLSWELALVALILFATESEAAASELRVGNVNAVQLAGLWFFAWLRVRAATWRSEALAAVWLGALIAFKPNLFILGCVLLFQPFFSRNWIGARRDALFMVIGGLLAVLLGAALWRDFGAWLDWFQVGRRLFGGIATVEQGNFAAVALFPDRPPALVLLTLSLAAGAAVWLGTHFRADVPHAPTASHDGSQVLWYLSVGCLTSLLVTQLAWLHYFLLVIPALLFLTSRWKPSRGATFPVGRSVLLLSSWLLFAMGPPDWFGIPPIIGGRCMLVGTLLLLGALWAQPEAPRIWPCD